MVSVVGGGAAGMMAAIIAARNGHKVHLYEKNEKLGKKIHVPSNGICRGFAFKYGKFLLPPRFLTALSVPKVPTREQLRLYNARKKCKANKFASSRQMWYITYSDEICLFLEKRRENKTYEENKI